MITEIITDRIRRRPEESELSRLRVAIEIVGCVLAFRALGKERDRDANELTPAPKRRPNGTLSAPPGAGAGPRAATQGFEAAPRFQCRFATFVYARRCGDVAALSSPVDSEVGRTDPQSMQMDLSMHA